MPFGYPSDTLRTGKTPPGQLMTSPPLSLPALFALSVLGSTLHPMSAMTKAMGNPPEPRSQRRYTWPWLVLAAVLLAIVLAILWMSREVERTRRIRDLNRPAPRAEGGFTSYS